MTNPPQVAVSEELLAPVSREIEICYQTFGDPADQPLLLVMGLAGPMTWWDADFCRLLAGRGFFVIRYDNRDTGRSTKMRGRVTRKQLAAAFLGRRNGAPYSLSDMAGDAIGLLDQLGIARAHLCGISMGGMIVQTLAIEHPERVASVTSIMSTTGQRSVGWQDPKLFPRLLARRQDTRERYVDTSVAFWKQIGSPGYPEPDDHARTRAGETFDRGISASGIMRQMMAILTQPNRTSALGEITAPLLVIHGLSDRMVHVSGGRLTSRVVPGSELLIIDGMGHDMPSGLWETFADGIRRNADRALTGSR
jgi:pimeloyl-ACP methyl ester carboxylesterase